MSGFAGMARSYSGRSRARIAATDVQAQQRRTSTRPGVVTLGLTTENARSPADRTQGQRSRPEEALERYARGAGSRHPRRAQGSAAAVTRFKSISPDRLLVSLRASGNEPAR